MSAITLTTTSRAVALSNGARLVIGTLLSLLSMGLFFLAFPPYDLWPLVFFAFVPMLVAQFRIMPARWSSLAAAITIGGWIGLFFRSIFSFGGEQVEMVWYIEWLPVIIGVITLLTDKARRAFHEQTAYHWFILEGAVGWVGLEFVRIQIFGTWGFISHPLYNQAWLLQPLSIFGIFGLGLLVVAINYSMGLGAIRWIDSRLAGRFYEPGIQPVSTGLTRRWLAGTAVAAALWVALSLLMFARIPDEADTIRVAATMPGTDVSQVLGGDAVEAAQQEEWDLLFTQTREAAAAGAQLVVWPEGAYLGFPQFEQAEELAALTAETGAYIALGYVVNEEEGLRNESILVTPQGAFLDPYGKAHPVFFAGETSVSRGQFPVHETSLGTIGIPICYDLDFTDVSRLMAAKGAQILAAPSNDWSGIAYHHYTHTVFRAIENRAAVIKAERAYNISIVDPYGRILDHTASDTPTRDLIIADVAVGTADSLYIQLGDWLGWLSLAGFIFFIIYPEIVKRRAKNANA